MSTLLSFFTPLLSAMVAGVVAWLVTLRQGHTARHNWVLDKRFGVYMDAFDAFMGVVRRAHEIGSHNSESVRTALNEFDTRSRLLAALTAPDLVAPAHIRDQADRCINLMWDVVGPDNSRNPMEFVVEIEKLRRYMWEDLIPESLR